MSRVEVATQITEGRGLMQGMDKRRRFISLIPYPSKSFSLAPSRLDPARGTPGALAGAGLRVSYLLPGILSYPGYHGAAAAALTIHGSLLVLHCMAN
ncbi:hypothetical protein KQX54_021718 [Cotesia glomerata]|uniref:Uncharacterized protein n=1 Tax=Cotesia glomerata TaxID=32391 RepID=A0AAV7J9G3_COTGL|nr:hypothetical protein KQX54_021718 [Cotesia glomerata]